MNPIEFIISLAILAIPTWIFYFILVKIIPLNLRFFSKIFLWLLISGAWFSLLGIIFYPYFYTEGTPGTFQKIHSQEETGLPNVPAEFGKLIDSL